MLRLREPRGLGKASVLLLIGLGSACGRTQAHDDDDDPPSAAGESGVGGSAAGGAAPGGAAPGGAAPGGAAPGGAGAGAFGGTGVSFGGAPPLGQAGTPPVEEPYVAVPLSDTVQCENDFVRVDQLPASATFFSALFDDEPLTVQRTFADPEPPIVSVFRFGATHVENVGFDFVVPEGRYSTSLNVHVESCDAYGFMLSERPEGVTPFTLHTGRLRTITYSVDGFSGLTYGTAHAEWRSDSGERHVLDAEFVLRAIMPDARAELL